MDNPYVNSYSLNDQCTQWLEKIAPFNTHKMKFNPNKGALCIIDMQKYFIDSKFDGYTCGGEAIIANLKNLISLFREHKRPIIFTRHVHNPDLSDVGIMGWWWNGMCKEGTPESEIIPELAPKPSEKVIFKHRYSAFYNTDLETVLRGLKIEDLIITGVMTNMCCESTARDAYFRDYRVFFVADGTGSINEEMHLASLLNLAFGFAYVCKTEEIINCFN